MWVVKACAVCLSTGVKLHNLNTGSLRHEFNSISGLKTTEQSGMPNHLCVECCAHVKKFIKFQKKCQRAYYTLQQMLTNNKEIKKTHLKALNREQLGLLPSISLINLDRAHYEAHHFKWITSKNLTNTSQFDYIPVVHYSTLTKEDTFSEVMTNTEISTKAIKIEDSTHSVSNEPETRKSKRRKLVVSDDNNAETKIIEPDDTQLTDINTFLVDSKFDIDFDDNDAPNDMEPNDFAANDIISNNFASNNVKKDTNDDLLFHNMSCQLNNKADGSVFNEEYGQMVPISVKEARAAIEIDKMFMSGDHKCQCGQKFRTEERLQRHARMHDKHEKGTFHCSICDYYYKTQFLLDVHMTEKHLYKYLCQMCPEVSFNRFKAKHHYCQAHLGQQKQLKSGSKLWQDRERPAWLSRRRKNKTKKKTLPRQIVKYAFDLKPISPEEQYSFVQKRKLSRNYIEAKYKCEFCFRGYRLHTTYTNHMVKHDPAKSGNFQCDMCKLYFRNQRKIYKHMNMYHLSSYTCMSCDYVSTNRSQALAHYKWHKNVTYDCSHCDKKFVKASTRLTHIRLKHPSTYICSLCGHSFVSSAGLTCHRQIAHSREELSNIAEQVADVSNANYCVDCEILFANEQAFTTHLGSSSKHVNTNISVQKTQRDSRKRMRREMGVQSRAETREVGLVKRSRNGTSEVHNTGVTTSNNCEVCGKYLVNDVQARRHYDTEHPGSDYLRRYMCEICGHTSKQYANLLVHMRTHTNEKPYECPHCDRRFSMLSNRDRHLVVHTGEKRFQCHHCSRRFTQSSAVKLHIQTVHLKIPYAPWDKKNRKRRKELEAAGVSDDMNLAEAPPLPSIMQQPQPKLILDTGEYINAYITYSDA